MAIIAEHFFISHEGEGQTLSVSCELFYADYVCKCNCSCQSVRDECVYRAMINYLNQSSLNDFAFYGIPPASFSNSALIAIYKLTLRLTAVRLA